LVVEICGTLDEVEVTLELEHEDTTLFVKLLLQVLHLLLLPRYPLLQAMHQVMIRWRVMYRLLVMMPMRLRVVMWLYGLMLRRSQLLPLAVHGLLEPMHLAAELVDVDEAQLHDLEHLVLLLREGRTMLDLTRQVRVRMLRHLLMLQGQGHAARV
jgi:hypothetical protein